MHDCVFRTALNKFTQALHTHALHDQALASCRAQCLTEPGHYGARDLADEGVQRLSDLIVHPLMTVLQAAAGRHISHGGRLKPGTGSAHVLGCTLAGKLGQLGDVT